MGANKTLILPTMTMNSALKLFTKLPYLSAEEGYYSSQVQVSFVFVNSCDSGDETHSWLAD